MLSLFVHVPVLSIPQAHSHCAFCQEGELSHNMPQEPSSPFRRQQSVAQPRRHKTLQSTQPPCGFVLPYFGQGLLAMISHAV